MKISKSFGEKFEEGLCFVIGIGGFVGVVMIVGWIVKRLFL